MIITKDHNEMYLYLSGVNVKTELQLNKHVTLMPSKCEKCLKTITSQLKSDADIGMAFLYLPYVTACLKITGSNNKDLACKVWNSQWDALLISALFNCNIGFYFQSDVKPQEFKNAKFLHVTNYATHNFSTASNRLISSSEAKWLVSHYDRLEELMKVDKYQTAIHILASYRWHSLPRAQLALLWSGIEGLFNIDYELSFRLGLCISKFLFPRNKVKRKEIFKKIKKLYGVRSKAVHGGKLKETKDVVDDSYDLLLTLIKKSADKGQIPDADDLCL